jgi:hypothetical protein
VAAGVEHRRCPGYCRDLNEVTPLHKRQKSEARTQNQRARIRTQTNVRKPLQNPNLKFQIPNPKSKSGASGPEPD